MALRQSNTRRMAIILLFLSIGVGIFWLKPLFSVKEQWSYTLRLTLVMVQLVVLMEIIKQFILLFSFGSGKRDVKKAKNFILGLRQISILVYSFQALAVFLSLFNLHLKDLITSLSVAAAAVAIVFKDYISNVINGMVLAFSNRLLIDDYVKIGHHRGRITDITLGSVQLLTDEDEVVFLPNTILFTHEIVNYSKLENRKTVLEFVLRYDEFEKIEDVEQFLNQTLKENSAELIRFGSTSLRIIEINGNELICKYQFTLDQSMPEIERKLKRVLNRAIVNRFRKK
jgi:small-conductance mechanosensitive channel